MTTGIATDVTLSPEPVQVPDGPDGATAVVVQLLQCRVLVLRGEDPPGTSMKRRAFAGTA